MLNTHDESVLQSGIIDVGQDVSAGDAGILQRKCTSREIVALDIDNNQRFFLSLLLIKIRTDSRAYLCGTVSSIQPAIMSVELQDRYGTLFDEIGSVSRNTSTDDIRTGADDRTALREFSDGYGTGG